MTDYAAIPLDPEATASLTATGLTFGLVDTGDEAAVIRWLRAETQGFHDPAPSAETLAAQVEDLAGDRVSGVWDPAGADADSPVATVRTWAMDLTVPGGGILPAWAISGVSVAPTHRRRGIARALLSAELRTARRAGLSMAMLTVSEATIYGRYGFGAAAYQARYSIDPVRARWTGPTAPGRVDLVDPASLLDSAAGVFRRARTRSPGEVDRRNVVWRKILGVYPPGPGEQPGEVRAARYTDEAGELQGFAIYKFVHETGDYPGRLELADLVAATDDAASALWRFLLEMDVINEIRTSLRSVSEPVARQVADYRAVRKTQERDHLWLRIIDVPTVLEARTYAGPGVFHLAVSDPLGFADGDYLLTVGDDGRASARPMTTDAPEPPSGAARLSLSVADLSALYLGGTNAVVLARAGGIRELTPGAAARLDTALYSPDVPWLSTWF